MIQLKLEVMKIEHYPENNAFHVQLWSGNERLAMSAFHSLITKLPKIIITPQKNYGGYTVEIPDNLFEIIDKQREEFNELIEQNPNTTVINRLGKKGSY